MGAILPLHALIIHQAHVSFMHQGGGLEAVAGALAFQVTPRQAAQFSINDGGQPFERALVSAAPSAQQLADFVPIRRTRLFHPLHRYGLNYTAAPGDSSVTPSAPTSNGGENENDSDYDRRGQLAGRA